MDFTKTRESGFLRFCLPENQNPPVGAAEGCDLLILFFQRARSKDRSLRQLLHFSVARRIRAGRLSQGALEKQYRLSLLQVFAMRQ
ncbi:hypothetical protein EJA70_30535 [Pseudomonas sp. PB103]|uniref:hypothetical protein n=1 Tax=Pseudomonas sp. PB103 TaxID=2494698 RepID=UPI00131D83F3|nr:hypothetical protein [Pseudomonas sp. PB103]KAE9638589.1 hypothetical protein EJA70_30535 [Pseudomonas sp. PB103]